MNRFIVLSSMFVALIGTSLHVGAKTLTQLDNTTLVAALKNTVGIWSGDFQRVSISNADAGQQALRIDWKDNPSVTQPSALTIPVGALADIAELRVSLRVVEKSGQPAVTISGIYHTWERSDQVFAQTVSEAELGVGTPVRVSIKNTHWDGSKSAYLGAVRLAVQGSGSSISFIVNAVECVSSKGTVTNLYDIDWSLRGYSLPPVVSKALAPPLANPIYIGTGSDELCTPEGRARVAAIQKYLPNLGSACNSWFPGLVMHQDFLAQQKIPYLYQVGGIFDLEPLVSEQAAHAVDANGDSLDVTPAPGGGKFHDFDWCHPAIRAGFVEAMKRLGAAGVPEFQFIDCVWPYWGNSGYSTVDIQAFRQDLLEKDNGLAIGASGEIAPKRMLFPEYVREATGVQVTPKDLGLASWEEYTPCLNGFNGAEAHQAWKAKSGADFSAKNFFLFTMLRHYEWLKLLNDVGIEAEKNGVRLSVMPNGDNWQNGNDYIGLMRLAKVKVLVDETHFYHPGNVVSSYRSLPVLRAIVQKYQKHHRLICETGLGGGGPVYLAPEFTYLMNYSLNASGHYDSMENDWVCGNTNENSDEYHVRRYADFLAKSFGYNDATTDKPERMRGIEQAVCLGSPGPFIVTWRKAETLGKTIDQLNYPWVLMDHREWTEVPTRAKVVFYDEYATPQWFADAFTQTVQKQPMTVVMHGVTAARVADGVNYTDIWWHDGINQPGLFSKLVGTVSATGGVKISGTATVADTGGQIPVTYEGPLYSISMPAKVLVAWNGKPLVSEVSLANGSRIDYLHFDPGTDGTAALEKYVATRAFAGRGIQAEGDTENCALQRFVLPDGVESVLLFNRKCLQDYQGPFAPHDKPYPYRVPGANCTASFRTTVKAPFVVYDFLSGKQLGTYTTSQVRLELRDVTAGLYYIVPTSVAPSLQQKLQARRAQLNHWLAILNNEFTPIATPQPFAQVAEGKPKTARFVTWSAMMDPANKGKTDGVTLNFHVREAGEYKLLGRMNLADIFTESPRMALPVENMQFDEVLLSVSYNGNTSFDNAFIRDLKLVQADGTVVVDLIGQLNSPTFTRGLQFGRPWDWDPAHFTASGAVFTTMADGRLSVHPAWNGMVGSVCGLWKIAQPAH